MNKLSIKSLRPGMTVGQSIYHTNGTFLLIKGTRLTPAYIQRLKELGFSSLYVSGNIGIEVEPPSDVIREETRVHAIKDIFNTFQTYQSTYTIDPRPLQETVNSLVTDLLSGRTKLVQISDLRLHDTYTFAHSVNVAALSAILATKLNYTVKMLKELVLGAILHDIGKTEIPPDILNKPGKLNPTEWSLLTLHPESGFRILSKSNQFMPSTLHIAFQHHEKFSGNGYPRKLSGEDIHESARIVAIADVYDALTSERSYKRPYKPNLAYKIMTTCSNGQFDPELLNLFFENVTLYPVGSILKIDRGYAMVTQNIIGSTSSPTITWFADNYKKPLSKSITLDLREEKGITIEYELEEQQFISLLSNIHADNDTDDPIC